MGTAAAGARRTTNPPDNGADEARPKVQYRLTRPEAGDEIAEGEDYTPFVLTATYAAIVLFVSQALSSMLIANYRGARLEIQFFFDLIPYVAIVAPRATFVAVITWSTAVAVATCCLGVVYGLIRHRKRPLLLYGWASGLFMAGLLIVFQYFRHRFDPPVVDIWVLAQCAGVVIATAVVFIGFKPVRAIPIAHEGNGDETEDAAPVESAPRRPMARSTPSDPPSARQPRKRS